MYADTLPLSAELRAAHEAALTTIARPGPSWTGAERRSMVESARAATGCSLCAARKAALSPGHVTGEHDDPTDLPGVVADAIHRIRTDPGRLTRSWFDEVTAAIGPAAYVELVSVVNTSVIMDTLHAALDQPLPALPQAEAGEPTGAATGDVVHEGAWVPITRAPRDMADTGLPAVPNILRAMGLVPDAVALFFSTFRPHYALKDIHLSISQTQAELVASRVSAWNECFY
ncbi:MAG: hypothetical protein EP301_09915 [Gammaproteobacteria bacterium]|nr:MAG: hypothetical protein EP301_09915 [Gammaproteobacteria bacterium]